MIKNQINIEILCFSIYMHLSFAPSHPRLFHVIHTLSFCIEPHDLAQMRPTQLATQCVAFLIIGKSEVKLPAALEFYNRHATALFMVQCYGAFRRFFNAPLPAAIRAFGALFRPLGSIRAFNALLPAAIWAFLTPYCLRQYGLLTPYFALWAQYGLLVPYFARWAQYGHFARLCARAAGPCAHTPCIFGAYGTSTRSNSIRD